MHLVYTQPNELIPISCLNQVLHGSIVHFNDILTENTAFAAAVNAVMDNVNDGKPMIQLAAQFLYNKAFVTLD